MGNKQVINALLRRLGGSHEWYTLNAVIGALTRVANQTPIFDTLISLLNDKSAKLRASAATPWREFKPTTVRLCGYCCKWCSRIRMSLFVEPPPIA